MAITGNSPRKSKTNDLDKVRAKRSAEFDQDSVGNDDDSNGNQVTGIFIKDSTENKASTSKNSKKSLELREDDLLAAEEYLQKFLLQTVGNSDSRVYDVILQNGRKQTFKSKDSILKQSKSGKGIYIILAGSVDILTSDFDDVINSLKAGDVFGEISTLFDIPVTANVTASTDVTLVNLPDTVTRDLFNNVENLDVIDWFIQRRYLPTGPDVDSARIYRRLALKTIKSLPLFSSWKDEMLKRLVLSFDNNVVTLYPEKSFVVLEKDPLTSIYIIMDGKFEIRQGSRIIQTFELLAASKPFVYTALALLVDGKLSPVTIKTLSNCQIINLKKEWAIRVLEHFPAHMDAFSEIAHWFRVSFKRLGNMYLKNEADLQIEVLSDYLKQSQLYCGLTAEQLWKVVLNGDLQECEVGSNVLSGINPEMYESVVLIRGEVDVLPRSVSSNDVILSESCTRFDDRANLHTSDEEGQNCVVGDVVTKGDNLELSKNKDKLKVGVVANLKDMIQQIPSLIAKTPCLILKLRKCSDNDPVLTLSEHDCTVDMTTQQDDLKMI